MQGCRRGCRADHPQQTVISNQYTAFHKGPRQSIRVAIYIVTFVCVYVCMCIHTNANALIRCSGYVQHNIEFGSRST